MNPARGPLACALALVACSAARPHARSGPPPRCSPSTHPGLASRALTWNDHGWGTLVHEGNTLYLRELDLDGAVTGERRAVLQGSTPTERLLLAWAHGAYYAATIERLDGNARILRFEPGSATPPPSARSLDDTLTGDAALVARDACDDAPVALFYPTRAGIRMRRIDRQGAPSSPQRCPNDLEPRNVTAAGEGFRALVPLENPSTGDSAGIDLVALDDTCDEAWRVRVWDGAVNGRVQAITASPEGTFVAFADRQGAVWLAAVGPTGERRLRARRLLRSGSSPRLVARPDGATLVAVDSYESADRIEAVRLDPEGALRDTRAAVTAPSLDLRFVAPEPWGGALVGWDRPDPTGGASRTAPPRFTFVTRICP